ncbi:MAG TPA: glycosyltransferase [Crocinitomix sp.]|nr:glycosyltransferase [Flavobacteriaceae bacterium]HIP37583.1 glycosyltransferase [Crocinitomix sp.]
MKKIKIIVDIERMKYPFTGLHNYCENLYKSLLNSNSNLFEFHFFSHSSVQLPKGINRMNRKLTEKLFLIKPKKYKLWHVTYQDSKFVPSGNIKIVYTIHDLNFLYTDKSEAKKIKMLYNVQEIIKKADYITVISNFVLNDIKKNLNLYNKPVTVIHNGVTVSEYPDFDNPKYRPIKKYIFTLGTVLYKKHFHVLPQMVAGTEYELIIAGILPDKDYVQTIESEIKKNNVSAQVTLTGPISDEEKYWYMKHCSAFVFPSISEGFGIPPIEAMVMGKPVFLSTYTSLPEVGGKLAYYFNSFDKKDMQKVFIDGMKDYADNDRKNEIIKWGKQFNWDKASKQYLDVYKQTLGIKPNSSQEELPLKPNDKNSNITALVITYNEENNIESVIENISFADEIIIVDSFSNDNTVEIIKSYPKVKLIQNKFKNFSEQRNFALAQTTNDWVLFIDADERISDNFINELRSISKSNSNVIAFKSNRKNYINNKIVNYSGWQNDTIYRFFNKKYVSYDEKKWVHETLIINGETKLMENSITHYSYKDFSDLKNRTLFYSKLKAKELYEKGEKSNPFKLYVKPFYTFIKHYFISLGIFDGKLGLQISYTSCIGVYKRYCELQKLYKTESI